MHTESRAGSAVNRADITEVARHAFVAEGIRESALEGAAGEALLDSYAVIAETAMVRCQKAAGRLVVLGLCGAQGSGKSTTARVVQDVLVKLAGLSVATLGIDDLYLSRAARRQLAHDVHPLLATRGVPGTHNVARGLAVIEALATATPTSVTSLPRFDKATDEPVAAADEPRVAGRPDVLLFEGWCVGARAEPVSALADPVNELERVEDPEGRWRRYVNERLAAEYQSLFGRLDALVMLRAPHFECVVRWRQEQEHKLAARVRDAGPGAGASRVMNDAEVARFVMHYERVSRHVLNEMPGYADVVVELSEAREVTAVRRRA